MYTDRILLMRHGHVNDYLKHGDCNAQLSDQGWKQSAAAGGFLRTHFRESDLQEWPNIWISPYLRTQQTLSGVWSKLEGLFSGEPPLKEDPRLMEQYLGALELIQKLIQPDPERSIAMADKFNIKALKFLETILRHVQKKDQFIARPLFGESDKDLIINVQGFIEAKLKPDIEAGANSHLIVGHGKWINAFISRWMNISLRDFPAMQVPGNCDIICIKGAPGNWSVEKIYDGENQQPVLPPSNPVEELGPLTIDSLPSAPEWLKNDHPG